MKAAKIVFWNENEERYEMQLGQMTCDSNIIDTASVKNLIVAPNDGDTFKLGSHTVNSSDNSITTSNSIYECNGRLDVYGGILVRKTNGVQAFSTGGGFIAAAEIKELEVIRGVQVGGNFSPILIKGDLMPESGNSLGDESTRWESVSSNTLFTDNITFTGTSQTIARKSPVRDVQRYAMNLAFIGYQNSEYSVQIGSVDNGVSQEWTEWTSEDGYKLSIETLRDASSSLEAISRFTLDLRSLSDASFSGDTVQKLHVPIGGLVMAKMPPMFALAHLNEEFHAGCVLEVDDLSDANQWTEALYWSDASSGNESIEGAHFLEAGLYRVIMGFNIVKTENEDGNSAAHGPFDKPILLQRIR